MKFTIKETRISLIKRNWYYEVEADSQEEAISLVQDGNVEHYEFEEEEEDDHYTIKDYTIEETN